MNLKVPYIVPHKEASWDSIQIEPDPDCIFVFLRSIYDHGYDIVPVIRILEDCTENILILLSWVLSLSPKKILVVGRIELYHILVFKFLLVCIVDNTSDKALGEAKDFLVDRP